MIDILGSNMLLTMPGIFYVFYIVFIYVGSTSYFIQKGSTNFLYLLAVHLVIIIFPLALDLTNYFMRINFKKLFNEYLNTTIVDHQSGNSFLFPYFILVLITLSITSMYYIYLDEIPLHYFLVNITDGIDIVDLKIMRNSATNMIQLDKLHRYNVFMVELLPILVLVALFKFKVNRQVKWNFIFILLSLLTIYRSISDLQKGPLIDFIILIFISIWIFKGQIVWRQVGYMLTTVLLALIVMYYYLMGISDLSIYNILSSIFTRLFLIQTADLYYYFSLFPDQHEFLKGVSLPNPGGIFQFEHFPLTKYVFMNGMHKNSIIDGSANSAFIGEIYANFGFIMMIFSIFVFSVILQTIQIKFLKMPRSLILSVFYAYLVFLSSQFALTSIFVVAHLYLFILVFSYIFLIDLYKIINIVFKK